MPRRTRAPPELDRVRAGDPLQDAELGPRHAPDAPRRLLPGPAPPTGAGPLRRIGVPVDNPLCDWPGGPVGRPFGETLWWTNRELIAAGAEILLLRALSRPG